MKLYYDFHIHTALSPCADDESTPADVVGMAKIKGLDVVAITDHNASDNCPAALAAGEKTGVLVLPGMELTTAEDIHVLCLFPSWQPCKAFADYVRERRAPVQNRVDIFGRQLLFDCEDNLVGEEQILLPVATSVPIYGLPQLVEGFGGIAIPAHIDKQANGIVATLGSIEEDMGFTTLEVSPYCPPQTQDFYLAKGYNLIHDSDAHYLWDISEPKHAMEVSVRTVEGVFLALKGEKL